MLTDATGRCIWNGGALILKRHRQLPQDGVPVSAVQKAARVRILAAFTVPQRPAHAPNKATNQEHLGAQRYCFLNIGNPVARVVGRPSARGWPLHPEHELAAGGQQMLRKPLPGQLFGQRTEERCSAAAARGAYITKHLCFLCTNAWPELACPTLNV